MTKEEQWKREAEIKLDELDDRGFDFDNWSISDAYERGYCDCAESKEKQIADLEKENAELKRNYDKRGNIIISLENQLRMYIHSDKTDQVTKAKELLQKCLNTYLRNPELRDEVEGFLKELEK